MAEDKDAQLPALPGPGAATPSPHPGPARPLFYGGGTPADIRPGHLQLTQTNVLGMTPDTARALTDMKKYEHAVPARNETYRHALTVGAVVLAVVWLLWLLTQAVRDGNQIAGSLVWAIVAIVAVLGAEPIVKAVVKQVKRAGTT